VAERLQRYLARAGVASRRHAELLITAGRVTVNNQPATTLGTKVEPNDLVALDGKLVMPPEKVSWYVLYKPSGVVTTLDDPQGRPTVLGLLGSIPTRVFPIGRLDWDAEGALLLTDDGAAAHRLLHPSFQVPRTYLAKVKGVPTDESLARLLSGVRLEDGQARALEVARFQAVERNTWLRVTVGEGRPHLVKRLCAAIGHPVVRLFRPHQAGISVAGMQPGELRPLRPEELALIAAVAEGKPVPPMTLTLPARRHGRADEEAEGGEGAAPRPPKPPRFGTRPFHPGPAGASPGRGPPHGGAPVRHAKGAERRGFGSGTRQGGASVPGRAGEAEGRGAFGARGGGRPFGRSAPGQGRPPRGGAGGGFSGTERPKEGTPGPRGGMGRGPPRDGRSFPGKSPRAGGERPGRPAWGKGETPHPGAGRGGFSSTRRGAPEGAPGAARREGGGGHRGKPPGGESRFSGTRRGPSAGAGHRAGAGRDFRPGPSGRGGFSGPGRGPGAAAGQKYGRPPSRGRPGPGTQQGGRPPRGAPPGERASRGERPRGARPAGRSYAPRAPGAGPRPSSGSGERGRPPQGRRGPPGPRGGGPRGPRR
jgi:23S rRNA pseudouridine2605 synthase